MTRVMGKNPHDLIRRRAGPGKVPVEKENDCGTWPRRLQRNTDARDWINIRISTVKWRYWIVGYPIKEPRNIGIEVAVLSKWEIKFWYACERELLIRNKEISGGNEPAKPTKRWRARRLIRSRTTWEPSFLEYREAVRKVLELRRLQIVPESWYAKLVSEVFQ